MRFPTVRLPILAGLSVIALAGCDKIIIHHDAIDEHAEQLAEAYCAVYEACDCGPIATDAVHPDAATCVSEEKARLSAAFEQAESDGLTFDSSCMNQVIANYESVGCESRGSLHAANGHPNLLENFGCALYHGDEVDEICEDVAGTSWSDCATGLHCSDATCFPIAEAAGVGDPCSYSPSGFSRECGPGLSCDPTDGCQPAQLGGEPCLIGGSSMQCVADHFCEQNSTESLEGVCQPLRSTGESCEQGDACDGWCVSESQECMDLPSICLDPELQPPT